MKRFQYIIICSIFFQIVLLGCPTYSRLFSANLNTISNDSIMDGSIFELDDILLDSVYPEASIKPTDIPVTNNNYSHSLKLHYTANNPNTPDFLIITPQSLYDSIHKEIKTYAEDLHTIYGFGIYIETVENENAGLLKSLINNYQKNLYGVFLIGDLSECMFEIEKDYNNNVYGYKKWPCDLFYMDLNGNWSDTDTNGVLDTHIGDVAPDIVFGRLSATGLSSLGSEVSLIRKQLHKSHNFWWKSSFHSADTVLNYIYKDWLHRFQSNYIASVFSTGLVDDIRNVSGSPFSKSDYLNRLSLSQYGFVHLAAHSSPTLHTFKEDGGYIYLHEISESVLNNKCLAYNLFCCSACNWLAASSQGYLGGIYLFNNGRTLSVVGSTKTGSMLYSNLFYSYLSTRNIGEAFRDWWRTELGNSNTVNTISWNYGLTILGDPMINFRHQVSDFCVANLTLTSFPPNNFSNLVMFKAGNSIKVTDSFIIPQGTHVIFDAPQVYFEKGFTCPTGASFETRHEGCEL